MPDITNEHLDAAILDQKVAGAFAGKRYAYIAIAKGGWTLGVAVANERGYNPIDGKTFTSQHDAREWAERLNAHIGIDDETASMIVLSTMGGPPVREGT